MTWIRTPNFRFFHDLSAVYTGAFSANPRARQARSPNDRPSARVCVMRLPAFLACSAVKDTASRIGLSAASHASPGLMPRLTSLLCTSARLTVLLAAVLNRRGVSLSAPGSRFSTARSAEASSTILFIAGRLAPFGDQLVSQRYASFHVPSDKSLGPLDTPLQRCDAQLIIFDSQHDFIADVDTERLAKGSWDHHTPIFIDTHAGFCFHCHIFHNVTLFYYSVKMRKHGRAAVLHCKSLRSEN